MFSISHPFGCCSSTHWLKIWKAMQCVSWFCSSSAFSFTHIVLQGWHSCVWRWFLVICRVSLQDDFGKISAVAPILVFLSGYWSKFSDVLNYVWCKEVCWGEKPQIFQFLIFPGKEEVISMVVGRQNKTKASEARIIAGKIWIWTIALLFTVRVIFGQLFHIFVP